MRKRRISILLLVVTLATMVLGGCQRRPLEAVFSNTVRVIVKCVWTLEAYPEKPTGMTLYFFRNDDPSPRVVTTSNVEYCEVQLDPGHYKLYMISQSPEEYWTMNFENMGIFSLADVSLITRSSRWYFPTRATENLVENPENMAVAVAEEFDITEEMVETYQTYYNLWRTKTRGQETLTTKATTGDYAGEFDSEEDEINYLEEQIKTYTIVIPLYPQNIVSEFDVTIYSDNADVLKSVRAATNGMARTFELTKFITGPEEATQLMEDGWSLTIDDPDRRIGHVNGRITTFGLPNGDIPSVHRDSTLNVSALLIDEATVENYKFNVGDKITVDKPNPGYRHLYRLVFGSVDNPAIHPPDVTPPSTGGGGFTANVSDWGEEIEAEIPI